MSSNTAATQQNHPWHQGTPAQGSEKKDAEGRYGPWVPQQLLSIIPARVVYKSENGKHAQLVQPCDPKRPGISELFQKEDKEAMVKYPRYLDEPKVSCGGCGAELFLSRIPWQSGCRDCKVPGWT